MANKNISKIREAICKNRGGLENASDAQITAIWNSLPADIQVEYFKSIETEKKSKRADS